LQTKIIHLDNFYNMFTSGCYNTAGIKYLEIFTDMRSEGYYLISGDWWHRRNKDTLKLYVSDIQQWKDIKYLLMMSKYPYARKLNKSKYS
jgi:hypothetical protein